MPGVRVVLVRPEFPANIGAVARVINNTGLSGLDLVRPGDWRTVECWRRAWGSHDVLEGARVFPDLAAALVGAHLSVAFTGRGDKEAVILDVGDAATKVVGLAPGGEARLVFGPETSGLTLDEIALCGHRATIPSHPAQPSLNLSHAVMIAAYDVFRASGRVPKPARRATHDDKEAFLALLEQGLRAIGLLAPQKRQLHLREWRALVQRLEITPRELRFLVHVAHKMKSTGRPEKIRF